VRARTNAFFTTSIERQMRAHARVCVWRARPILGCFFSQVIQKQLL